MAVEFKKIKDEALILNPMNAFQEEGSILRYVLTR